METFTWECKFPFLCKSCNSIVQANALDPKPQCPGCGSVELTSYSHPALCGSRGECEVVGWTPRGQEGPAFTLHDGTYWCPKCKSFRLRFTESGIMWD